MAFKKRYADASLFSELPESIYEFTGGIKHDPLQLLAVSRILGGQVYGTDHRYTTTTNKNIEIPVGSSWLSLRTIREDTFAATGREFTRAEVRGAVRRAIRNGYISDEATLYNGRYGKIYSVSVESAEENMINPVEAYRYFYHGNLDDFKRGEIVVGQLHNRGKFGNVDKWINHVAKKGLDKAAFASVGRWRYGEEGQHDKPVFVPYLIIDLDRELVLDAFKDAKEILNQLYLEGLDLDRTFVMFSGRRGFHIKISTDQFGSPIFSDAVAAQKLLRMFVSRTVDSVEVDPSTFSPLSVVRLSNSLHDKVDNRTFTFIGSDFLGMSLGEVFGDYGHEKVTHFPKVIGEIEDELYERWIETVEKAKLTKTKEYGKRIGPKVGRIVKGIGEGEVWSKDDVGRNRAAFVLGCWVLEDPKQRKQVCDLLGYETVNNNRHNAAYEVLEYWNRNLNKPPLREHELKRTFRSAVKTIDGIGHKYASRTRITKT